VENGANAGTVFTLSSGGTYLMGREGAEIVFDEPKASRKHAEISLLGPDAYFLRDLASTNGTFVNGRRVTEKVSLRSEDRIRIGDTMLGFFVVEGAINSDATNGQRGAKIR
jgi:pSer/pThr/pTyr-binding forkhead associated (FHA) protein